MALEIGRLTRDHSVGNGITIKEMVQSGLELGGGGAEYEISYKDRTWGNPLCCHSVCDGNDQH